MNIQRHFSTISCYNKVLSPSWNALPPPKVKTESEKKFKIHLRYSSVLWDVGDMEPIIHEHKLDPEKRTGWRSWERMSALSKRWKSWIQILEWLKIQNIEMSELNVDNEQVWKNFDWALNESPWNMETHAISVQIN